MSDTCYAACCKLRHTKYEPCPLLSRDRLFLPREISPPDTRCVSYLEAAGHRADPALFCPLTARACPVIFCLRVANNSLHVQPGTHRAYLVREGGPGVLQITLCVTPRCFLDLSALLQLSMRVAILR